MARCPGSARRWLSACVVAVAATSVAGCVGMPSNGPVGAISVSPQSTAAGGDVIEPFPSGPKLGESPSNIVQGFLAASANYPANATIARQYLTGSVARTWNPPWTVTVFSTFGPLPQTQTPRPGARQTKVVVSGQVQSTFNGPGQFVSAGQGDTAGAYPFTLTKVGSQWRISDLPNRRLLTGLQFSEFYRAQDLYFVNPSVPPTSPEQPLVPDSVFVPVGTSTTDLLNKLVNALLPDPNADPKSSLLKAAATTFPGGTTLISAALAGTTAVVNLAGLAHATGPVLEQVSAQLAWTLASPRTGGPPAAIQSVELERNGRPWIPPETICGVKQARSQVQNQAAYSCYNPDPSQQASFSFTSQGQILSRCGSEASAQRGLVGPVVSLFRAASAAQSCPGSADVPTVSTTVPPKVTLPSGYGTPSLTAVSPDGQYAAAYSPDAKVLFTWKPPGGSRSLEKVPGVTSGVTALSWDRSDDLWFTQNGGEVFMMSADGQLTQVTGVSGVTDLSVAPDGVRIAFIVQDGPRSSVVDLAAVVRNAPSSQGKGPPSANVVVSPLVHLGPDLSDPQDLTWYDADDLIVLARNSGPTLSEVPVDGQESASPVPAPPGAVSITANGTMNALVAGRSDQRLVVSTGLEGPWQLLNVPGQDPAYPG